MSKPKRKGSRSKQEKKTPKRARVKRSHLKRIEKVRIYPNFAQTVIMNQILYACMLLYNAALMARKRSYDEWSVERVGKHNGPTYKGQCKETTALRHDPEFPMFGKVYSEILAYVMRRVQNTFNNYFDRMEANLLLPEGKRKKVGFPRTKTVSLFRTFTFSHASRKGLNESGSIKIKPLARKVKIPGVGWMTFRNGKRGIPLGFKVAHITRKNEKWYICFEHVIEQKTSPVYDAVCANDAGFSRISTCSDGSFVENPRIRNKFRKKIIMWTKRKNRCTVGSRRYNEAVFMLAKIEEKIANCRTDYAHKESRKTANKPFDVFIKEDLDITNLVMKEGEKPDKWRKAYNSKLYDSGTGGYIQKLDYKVLEIGKQNGKVNPAYTSQTCSRCKKIDGRSRISQSEFVCTNVACNLHINADYNATLNLLARWESLELQSAVEL